MKIAILSTDTFHHRYFVKTLYKKLPKTFSIDYVIFEKKKYPWGKKFKKYFLNSFPNVVKGLLLNPYIQFSYFNAIQDKFEFDFLLKKNKNIPDEIKLYYVTSINDSEAINIIKNNNADIAFIYGTGKIYKEVFSLFPSGSINAHGGKLPDYKGLDTNLWASLEEGPSKMMVTLHEIDENIDTGDIYLAEKIKPTKYLNIYTLRGFTAIQCTDMFLRLIKNISKGKLIGRKQIKNISNKNYSPMPFLYKLKVKKIISSWVFQNNK